MTSGFVRRAVVGLIAAAVGLIGFAAAGGANEPDYYVQWIGFSNTSGPYINTGYAFTRMPLVEAGIMLGANDSDIMGTDTAQNGCFIVDVEDNGTRYYYRYGSSANLYVSVSPGPSSLASAFNDMVWGPCIYQNGTLVGKYDATVTDANFASNVKPFYIFKGRSAFASTAKLSYCRMYNGIDKTELVRDFRPGVKNGVAGLYDAVGDKFYTNAGSGTFAYGLRAAETNAVFVDTNWLQFGPTDPGYGTLRGLAAGEARTFTAPSGLCETGGYAARCTGWKLYKFNSSTGAFLTEPYLSGDGTTCSYTHPDPGEFVRLEWQWQPDASHTMTAKAGEWDDPEVWASGSVPTEETVVEIKHNVHCSSNVHAKAITVHSGATLRFHAATSSTAYDAVPDATGCSNFTFRVERDLTLAGGSLLLHGGRTTPVITNLNLSVGGDVTLSNAATMCVAAAAYNGPCCDLTNLYNTATRLRIGGALVITNTATLYTVCDQKVGSPVRIDCTNFTLGASAKICADERGWHWLAGTADSRRKFTGISRSKYTFAHGPGLDTSRMGGGYGGHGSNCSATTEPTWGATYGDAFAPFAPGSPSGGDSNYSLNYGSTAGQCRGGGVIRVEAGSMRIDGTLTADGLACQGGNSSGGTIFLVARGQVAFGPAASLSVWGGYSSDWPSWGAGGGGGVAICSSFAADQLAWLMANPSKPFGPYTADARPRHRIRDATAKLLADRPDFADAPAPGSAARGAAKCWGSFKALRGAPPGAALLVR